MQYTFEMSYIKEHPEALHTGAIIKEETDNETIYYLVKTLDPQGSPTLSVLTTTHKTKNKSGDWMVNLRTGYVSIYDDNDKIITTEKTIEDIPHNHIEHIIKMSNVSET